MSSSPAPSGPARAFGVPRAPWPLVVAMVAVALEAVALTVLGVVELVGLSSGRVVMGATTAVFFLAYAGALAVFAWLMLQLRSWTRAPLVLAQLIQLGLAWSFRGGSTTSVAVILGLGALVVLAGIFAPASLAAIDAADRAGDDSAETTPSAR